MLAKPLKIAGATALPTNSRRASWSKDGGTASMKRTQGRQYQCVRHGERARVPPGSSKIVARSQRSVNDELPVPHGRTGAPRTREALLPSPPHGRVACIRLKVVASGSGKESDSPIVVRDGRADHMAKGWAERQSEQSTHRGRRLLLSPVSRTLLALATKFWLIGSGTESSARLSEEPCAGKPHAGICEGGAR